MKKALLALFALISTLACNNPDPADDKPDLGFDRSKMLENMARNLIRPAFADLLNDVTALESAAQTLANAPTEAALADVRQKWLTAVRTWPYANLYNFGPAGEEGLRLGLHEEVGKFPAGEQTIEQAIAAGQWDLSDANRNARGLYAVEYLIFGKNMDAQQVMDGFVQSPPRAQYLAALCADIKSRVSAVVTGWQTYEANFVTDAGTSAGSSSALLYNELVRCFNQLKNHKLALPLGRYSGFPVIAPEKVEAYYSGASLQLIEIQITAMENLWHGRSRTGVDGMGFREYLADVVGGADLIARTEAQFVNIRTALAAVPQTPPMSVQVKNAPAPLEALHDALREHTRFFKSSMSSLLGIAITFENSDGD
jgi:uncharacterized protein